MKNIKLPIVKEGREEYWNRQVKWDRLLALELAPYHDSSFAARCSKCFLRNHPRAARLRAITSYPCVLTRQIHTSGSLGLRHCKLSCPFRPSVGISASNLLQKSNKLRKTVCPSTIMSTKSIAIATTFEGTS